MKRLLGILTAIFVIALIGSFILFFSAMDVLFEFELITEKMLLVLSCVAAFVFAVVCIIIAILLMKAEKKTKFGNWLSSNIAKITLAYTFLTIFFFSVKSEVILTIEELKEIISLGWTILGISVGIFLIWNVIAMEYLEKKKPNKPLSSFPTKQWRYIQEKSNFYSDATMLLSNVNLLLVNLLVLVVVTVLVFVTSRKATILSQSATFLVLFLCTNTIVGLMLDILKPFNEKKKSMLQETKVTSADVDLQNEIDQQTEIVLKTIEIVEDMQNVGEEVKKQVVTGILESYLNKFGETLEESQVRGD